MARRAFELMREACFAARVPCSSAIPLLSRESGVDFGKASVRAGFGRGHLLDIVVYLPGGNGTPAETEAAEQLVRLLAGEELFERWLGNVTATPAARVGALTVINSHVEQRSALPIETLPKTLDAAIAGLRLGLPSLLSTVALNDEDWLLFELDPEAATDFAAQDDLLVCSTRAPELKKSFLRGERFFSGRFCSSGALFAYLKYESSERSAQARLEERARFEGAAASCLPQGRAALVGLGLGVRYGYLDLAIGDPDWVCERLLPALRDANIARRAWLLFCDSELEREHLALYPDSPEPFWG